MFLAVAAFLMLLIVAVASAGVVYRTQCATAEGTVETKWTYEWDTVVPFLRPPKENGCDVHNAARVLLSETGVAPLNERSAREIARGYADNTSDASLIYLSAVYMIAADLREATRKQSSMRPSERFEKYEELEDLTPPPSVAEEHRKMLAAYLHSYELAQEAQGVIAENASAGLDTRLLRLLYDSASAMAEFVRWAEQIRATILAEQAARRPTH